MSRLTPHVPVLGLLLLTGVLASRPASAQPLPTASPPAPEETPAEPVSPPASDAPTEPHWSQELSLEELLQLELATPSKQLQPAREAPGVVSVVPREQIRRFGWMSLDDILFSQPGFFPAHDYERTVVGARGISEGWNNNHLLLLVDGVPMNDNEAGSAFTWDVTPLFLVKSVEIVRGPGSALYGSSATNGVVALNTISSPRTLREDERLEVNSEARLRLGDRGTVNVDAVAATVSEHLSAVLGFRHLHTNGYSYLSYDGSGRTDDTGALQRFRIDDAHSSDYLFLKLEAKKALEGLSLQYHLQSWEHSTGHGWLYWAPDVDGPMHDRRHIVVLRYQSPRERRLQQEYVFKLQRHDFERNVRLYPSGALEGRYPAGVNEVLETRVDELFGRAQLSGELSEGLSLLSGVEYSAFLYGGDRVHYANIDLFNAEEGAPAPTAPVPLGPFFEGIIGHPVNNLGAYTQLAWSRLLGMPLSLTVGLRYDLKFFHYREPRAPESPTRFKSYDQLSPRLALVYSPSPLLSLKAQASRAFRAPVPAELFGANTWMLSANIDMLRPEQVTTFELNADWTVNPHLSWRNTVFHSRFDNLIGYSDANLSSNLFSRSNAGLESELLGDVDLGEHGQVQGFGSYTYVHMLAEHDDNGGHVASAGNLTWAPAHVAKAGLSYSLRGFTLSLQGRYQGAVHRREGDSVTPAFIAARPTSVPAWVRFDANARYQLNTWASVGVKVSNLLDAESYLVKIGNFPFDYRMEGRRLFVSLEFDL
ncbi:TonB-dependent receptor [Archangium sp.]|jgi:iron complex outermembrane receptor protein|uniref:TonB-dependent receptor plug domain-containing protein n=1 Tax=Archangium sp. TaxID=1872627 RepID=UPI002ED8D9E2